MVRAFIASYDECVGKEEEETARTKKDKNILMARRRENASRGTFASQIPSEEVGALDAVPSTFMFRNLRLAIVVTKCAGHVNTTTI